MAKLNRTIEIVRTSEPGLSAMSQRSADAILFCLKKYYTNVQISEVNNLSDLNALIVRKPDLVFLGIQCLPMDYHLGLFDPNKLWVSRYLQSHGIVSTGSGSNAHKLEISKPSAKQQVLNAELATAPFHVIGSSDNRSNFKIDLSYPLFIKPTSRGGGVGVDENSYVVNSDQLWAKVDDLRLKYNSDALVEEYLPGREFSVAILKQLDSDAYSLMPVEISSGLKEASSAMLSSAVKTSNTEVVTMIDDESLKTKINILAAGVFSALGAQDYGRIDIRLDKNNQPCFLEANLFPSIIEGYGTFPKSCLINSHMGYEEVINRIVDLAFDRANLQVTDVELATIL